MKAGEICNPVDKKMFSCCSVEFVNGVNIYNIEKKVNKWRFIENIELSFYLLRLQAGITFYI